MLKEGKEINRSLATMKSKSDNQLKTRAKSVYKQINLANSPQIDSPCNLESHRYYLVINIFRNSSSKVLQKGGKGMNAYKKSAKTKKNRNALEVKISNKISKTKKGILPKHISNYVSSFSFIFRSILLKQVSAPQKDILLILKRKISNMTK